MPGRKNGNNNNLKEQQEQRLYETTLKNTGMAMRGQVDEGDEIEQFLSSRRPFYVDNYADLSEEERRHREPEILAVNGYTEARYRNTLTVEQANVYKNALIAYYMSMAAVSRPKNRTEETEKKLAQCKIDMLRNGWTPEDMALVDSIFLRTYDSDRKVRDKAEKCLDEIRKIKIEHVSDRAKAHASVQDLIEEMEKNNPFGSMILDGCARNTFERPILPVEYPQDEAYQQMLNDMMVTNLQGEDEVAGANAYLRDRAEERRKNEQAQMQTRLKDDYVMPVTSEKGDNNYKANLAQVPAWRGGISNRAAAKAVFGDAAYDLIDEVNVCEDENGTGLWFKQSVYPDEGKRLADTGNQQHVSLPVRFILHLVHEGHVVGHALHLVQHELLTLLLLLLGNAVCNPLVIADGEEHAIQVIFDHMAAQALIGHQLFGEVPHCHFHLRVIAEQLAVV